MCVFSSILAAESYCSVDGDVVVDAVEAVVVVVVVVGDIAEYIASCAYVSSAAIYTPFHNIHICALDGSVCSGRVG